MGEGVAAGMASDKLHGLPGAVRCMCSNSKGLSVAGLGEIFPPSFLQRFMCFRMVSAWRPPATADFAICCEYHTSDMPGLLFLSSR